MDIDDPGEPPCRGSASSNEDGGGGGSSSSSSENALRAMRPSKDIKRRKVTQACVYCRRSHMTCDEGRPCQRCVKRNISHLCHDETRTAVHNGKPPKAVTPPAPAPAPAKRTPKQAANPLDTNNSSTPRPRPASASAVSKTAALVTAAVATPPVLVTSATTQKIRGASQPVFVGPPVSLANDAVGNEINSLLEFLAKLDQDQIDHTGLLTTALPHTVPIDESLLAGVMPTSTAPSTKATTTATATTATTTLPVLSTHNAVLAQNLINKDHSSTTHAHHRLSVNSNHGLGNNGADPSQIAAAAASNRVTRSSSNASSLSSSSHSKSLSSVSDKQATFFMTAADPTTEGTSDERLMQVIRAKEEAGLLKPHNFSKGYSRLVRYMDRHMTNESRARIIKVMSEFRPKFRSIAQSLTETDLILVEESFERMLYDYDRVFTAMGVPSCLWRRTGEIHRANREFAELVGLPLEYFRDGQISIYELMAEQSDVNYWEKYGNIAFDVSQKAVLTSCVLKKRPKLDEFLDVEALVDHSKESSPQPTDSAIGGSEAPGVHNNSSNSSSANNSAMDIDDCEATTTCCFSFTIRRDKYHIPMIIVGNFLPID